MPVVDEVANSRRGAADLCVSMVSGQSTLTACYSSSPLKLLAPASRGLSVWAYLSNLGGGLVAGDETQLHCRVEAGARCFVGTQSSTKVYRNPERLPCTHLTRAVLEEGSLLVMAPDPVQGFADSSYSQSQAFHLGKAASLVLVDWYTSGRMARGERWAFHRLQSRNEVWMHSAASLDPQSSESGQTLAFLDSLTLDSSKHTLNSAHRLGRFNCIAMVLLLGPLVGEGVAQMLNSVAQQPVLTAATLCLSASPLAGGALLRIAGMNTRDVGREIERHLAFIPPLLGDNPWARRF